MIQRHGHGDGVITLNVGGTKFQTLRSTIAQNAVLMDHVARAEANAEISSTDGAVFVDRDPKHFGMILSYLRNKADGVHRCPSTAATLKLMRFGGNKDDVARRNNAQTVSSSLAKSMSSASFVQLPKDTKTLTEMYFESMHYDIPELTNQICSQQSLARLLNVFGSANPIQVATTAFTFGRRALMLFGTVGTAAGGWLYTQAGKAQIETTKFVEESTEAFWKKQTEYWKTKEEEWRPKPEGQ